MVKLAPATIAKIDANDLWGCLYHNPQDFLGIAPALQKLGLGDIDFRKNFTQYVNKISDVVAFNTGLPEERALRFSDTSSMPIRGHPIYTDNEGPCRHVFAFPSKVGKLQWGDFEASAGIHLGPSTIENLHEVVNYASMILAARPDRVYTQALYAHSGGVQLIMTRAGDMFITHPLNLATAPGVELLYAFVQRLYKPHNSYLDPTMLRRWDPQTDSYVFDIVLLREEYETVECRGYRLAYSGTRTDKRTHVFVNRESPGMLEYEVYAPVIKEVYVDEKYQEDVILLRVHTGRGVPGVVEYAHCETVKYDPDGSDINCGEFRRKVRIALRQYGDPFMALRTPRDVLLALYDLLESTRVMHRNCSILHRDIGKSTVLIENGIHQAFASAGTIRPGTTYMDKQPYGSANYCSARYLLQETAERTVTSNLLIGFEQAVVDVPGEIFEGNPSAGDPMFMARAMRLGRPLGITGERIIVPRIPELVPAVQAAYSAAHPDRSARFRCHTAWHTMYVDQACPARHALRHDAESVFWLFVWWLATAVPPGAHEGAINPAVWSALTAGEHGEDVREAALGFGLGVREFVELDRLVTSLWSVVRPELHWATEAPYTDPEFVHEAMQRHILNFLVANNASPFLRLSRATELRLVRK